MGEQLVPKEGKHFRDDRSEFMTLLRGRKPDVTRVYSAINPYPWALTAAEVAGLERVANCIRRAIRVVVEHYFDDPRLRAILPLEADVEKLLRVADRFPYRIGAIRPDFLHAADGTIQINEINARFPLNAFLISHLLDAIFAEVPYRHRFAVGFKGIPGPAKVPEALQETFGDRARVVVLKKQERGWDTRLLVDYWPGCQELPPEEAGTLDPERDFVVLELHQHELVRQMPRLPALITSGRYLNDVRTIFLGHDKRLLAIFTSDLLDDYLPAEDIELLHRHVVPTYVIGLAGEPLRRARERREEWLLKPNLFGKGEGIVIGRNVSADAWRAALDSAPRQFVLQPFVEQRRFDVMTEVGGDVRRVTMNVVGLLPTLNEHCLGPGIYRASPGDIVNVAGGGTIMVPVVVPQDENKAP